MNMTTYHIRSRTPDGIVPVHAPEVREMDYRTAKGAARAYLRDGVLSNALIYDDKGAYVVHVAVSA